MNQNIRNADKKTNDSSEYEGLSAELLEMIAERLNESFYYRILSKNEKKAISSEAFGYLLKLNSDCYISKFEFEKILSLSFALSKTIHKVISLRYMVKIVDILFIENNANLSYKRLWKQSHPIKVIHKL